MQSSEDIGSDLNEKSAGNACSILARTLIVQLPAVFGIKFLRWRPTPTISPWAWFAVLWEQGSDNLVKRVCHSNDTFQACH